MKRSILSLLLVVVLAVSLCACRGVGLGNEIGTGSELDSEHNAMMVNSESRPNVVYCRPDHVASYRLEESVIALDNLITHPEVGYSNNLGGDVCILRKENPQEVMASWLFVKFLTTNKEIQSSYSLRYGTMPVLKSVVQDTDYVNQLTSADGGDGIQLLALKATIEQQNAYFSLSGFAKSYDVYSKMGDLLVEAMSLAGDVENLFEKALRELKP